MLAPWKVIIREEPADENAKPPKGLQKSERRESQQCCAQATEKQAREFWEKTRFLQRDWVFGLYSTATMQESFWLPLPLARESSGANARETLNTAEKPWIQLRWLRAKINLDSTYTWKCEITCESCQRNGFTKIWKERHSSVGEGKMPLEPISRWGLNWPGCCLCCKDASQPVPRS